MKCSVVRNRLLSLEVPTQVPEKFRAHLDDCPACQAWLARFEQVEGAIRRLRVPATSGQAKAALLQKVLHPTKAKPVTPKQPMWNFSTLVERYWHGGLIAATLLIGAIAFFNVGGKPPELAAMPPDPLLREMVDVNLELVEADTPSQRINKLSRIADQLYAEIRDIARIDASGENLQKLSMLYHRVVMRGIVEYAPEIPLAQWNEILVPLSEKLNDVSTRTEAFARTVQANAVEPLRNVAFDAGEASKRIMALMKGRTG